MYLDFRAVHDPGTNDIFIDTFRVAAHFPITFLMSMDKVFFLLCKGVNSLLIFKDISFAINNKRSAPD